MTVERFRALHRRGDPLLLPNAWDFASGALLARHGFAAIATTSLGVAAVHGKPDGAAATRAETVALAAGLSQVDCLLSVDVEGGFSTDPGEVVDLALELAELGVVGVNIEDGRADGTLAPVGQLTAIVAAVRAATGLFVNARTDTHWLPGHDDLRDTLHRLQSYVDAGADGVFVPGLTEPGEVAAVVAAVPVPLNVLLTGDLDELAELGVARVSTGSLLYRAALAAALRAALTARGDEAPTALSYGDVQDLLPD